jgi:hypothetical protein
MSQHRGGVGAAPGTPIGENVSNIDDPAKRAQIRAKFYRSVI